ncbi:hypothetical protein L484_026271 [Morus notabilis]|uniref:Uncharacterized protein n=1 Tax=Morus notabilis TaxID=981085 RepID=W9REJ5_9ROSA|nr:hypothetical protein L484_026271 [Morus notabilis]
MGSYLVELRKPFPTLGLLIIDLQRGGALLPKGAAAKGRGKFDLGCEGCEAKGCKQGMGRLGLSSMAVTGVGCSTMRLDGLGGAALFE